jgi:hypothetical protein
MICLQSLGKQTNTTNKEYSEKALWDDKCKQWISKQGHKLLTYFDLDAQNYRTAKNYSIIYDVENERAN